VFKQKCIWQFFAKFRFHESFLLLQKCLRRYLKVSRFRESFTESHLALSVSLKNFAKLIKIFVKLLAFAPVFSIFSLKISGEHIFMRKFSGKKNILQAMFTRSENDFRETLRETWNSRNGAMKVYSVLG